MRSTRKEKKKMKGREGIKAAEEKAGGGGCVFRQQRVVCGWEVLATEAVPHLFYSGQPLPSLHTAWT